MKQPVPPYKEFCPDKGVITNCQSCNEDQMAHLDVLEWKSQDPAKAIVVCIHAMFLSAKAFCHLGNMYVNKGFNVYALDIRGFGQKRNLLGFNKVNFKNCVQDIEIFLKHLKSKYPKLPIILIGESMGGALSLKVASELPHLVDSVICSAPAWQLFTVPRVTYLGLMDKIVGEPGRAAELVLTSATNCPKLQDYWRNEGSTRLKLTIEEAYAYLKLMKKTPYHAKNINSIPTLVIQGLNDRLSKPSASANLYKRLRTPNKQFLIAAHKEHVVLEENQLTEEVSDFMNNWIQYHLIKRGQTISIDPVTVLGQDTISTELEAKLQALISIANETK